MAFRNIGVYRGSETLRYHLDQFKLHTPNEWAVYDDLGHFLNSGHPSNIGFFHLPYPFTPDTQSIVDQLCNFCNHVFIIGSELHNVTADFIRNNDRKNLTFYICGTLNFSLQNAKVFPFMDWFETTSHFYKNYLPEILGRFSYDGPAAFDILLGRKKLHRDFVYNFANTNLRNEDRVMTYFNEHEIDTTSISGSYTWDQPGLRYLNTPKWTVDRVEYFGHRMSLSQVIPISLYNQTSYTAVAETNFNSGYSFYTEKTVKPIIARRLFIMFAGPYYLRNLREFGFQTFDGIIDESYDTVVDDQQRWQAACEQMKWLCSQNSNEIRNKIKSRVDHNFEVMMSRDWLKEYVSDLESKVDTLVQQIAG